MGLQHVCVVRRRETGTKAREHICPPPPLPPLPSLRAADVRRRARLYPRPRRRCGLPALGQVLARSARRVRVGWCVEVEAEVAPRYGGTGRRAADEHCVCASSRVVSNADRLVLTTPRRVASPKRKSTALQCCRYPPCAPPAIPAQASTPSRQSCGCCRVGSRFTRARCGATAEWCTCRCPTCECPTIARGLVEARRVELHTSGVFLSEDGRRWGTGRIVRSRACEQETYACAVCGAAPCHRPFPR